MEAPERDVNARGAAPARAAVATAPRNGTSFKCFLFAASQSEGAMPLGRASPPGVHLHLFGGEREIADLLNHDVLGLPATAVSLTDPRARRAHIAWCRTGSTIRGSTACERAGAVPSASRASASVRHCLDAEADRELRSRVRLLGVRTLTRQDRIAATPRLSRKRARGERDSGAGPDGAWVPVRPVAACRRSLHCRCDRRAGTPHPALPRLALGAHALWS